MAMWWSVKPTGSIVDLSLSIIQPGFCLTKVHRNLYLTVKLIGWKEKSVSFFTSIGIKTSADKAHTLTVKGFVQLPCCST